MDLFGRIIDLFAEGTELHLGDDPDGNPVVVWINKLNSFEVEEARRDGITYRGLRMANLSKKDNPERQHLESEIALWTDDELREHWAGQQSEENLLKAFDDLEAEEGWQEKADWLRRAPQLLADRQVDDEDETVKEFAKLQAERTRLLGELHQKRHEETLARAQDMTRDELERSFFENWRQRLTLDEYIEEKRVTELWIALRQCSASRVHGPGGSVSWDHSTCDHSQRLLGNDKGSRARVRTLPPEVVEKAIEKLDAITLNSRDAGNSDAPRSSSAPSERSSESEAASTPSSPGATSGDALTT